MKKFVFILLAGLCLVGVGCTTYVQDPNQASRDAKTDARFNKVLDRMDETDQNIADIKKYIGMNGSSPGSPTPSAASTPQGCVDGMDARVKSIQGQQKSIDAQQQRLEALRKQAIADMENIRDKAQGNIDVLEGGGPISHLSPKALENLEKLALRRQFGGSWERRAMIPTSPNQRKMGWWAFAPDRIYIRTSLT